MNRPRRLLVEALEPRQLLSAVKATTQKAPTDDGGNTFAAATPIKLSSTGTYTQAYKINRVGDVDYFSFTSPVTAASPTTNARLVIREVPGPGAMFPAVLSVYGKSQNLLKSIYNDPVYPDSSASFTARAVIPVSKGSLYYVEAEAYPGCVGNYQLQISVDNVTDVIPGSSSATPQAPPPTAVTLANGAGGQAGTINYPGDVDVFSYTASVTGNLTINEKASAPQGSTSALGTVLSVFDTNGNLVSPVPGLPVSAGSQTISVMQGARSYIQAAGFANGTGGYVLQFSTLRAPADNTFATANCVVVPVDPTNSLQDPLLAVAGSVAIPGDVSFYKFVAPVTGQITIQQTADTGSPLDSYLYVYDADQRLLWKNDDSGVSSTGGLSKDSLVTVSVTAGATYYAEAAGHNSSTGAYHLKFSTYCTTTADTANYPNSPTSTTNPATVIPPMSDASGLATGTATGAIDYVGDVHWFSFFVPQGAEPSVPMNFRETAGSSLLAPHIYVYDANLNPLGNAAAALGGSATVASLSFNPGQTYYIEATGDGLSAGAYTIQCFSTVPYFLGLHDPALIALVKQLYAKDGMITRLDMIQILDSTVSTTGPVTTTGELSAYDFTDLKTLVSPSAAAALKMPGYVQTLATDVIDGNTANSVATYPAVKVESTDPPIVPAAFQGTVVGNLRAYVPGTVIGTQYQMLTLVGKWFLGTDRPTPDFHPAEPPDFTLVFTAAYSAQPAAGTLYNTTGDPAANPPIPPNTPSYEDLSQGALGDCYYLASLGAVAKTNPAAIENMILDNGDGTYTVRFYNAGVPDYVTVDKYLAVDPGTFPAGFGPGQGKLIFDGYGQDPASTKTVLWVPLLEKAYTEWNAEGYEEHGIMVDAWGDSQNHDGVNVYWGIGDGGWANAPCTQILGTTALGVSRWNWPISDQLLPADQQTLVAAIQSNEAVTFGTVGSPPLSTIVGGHEYVAIGYSAATQLFRLYNPWGTDATGQPGTDPEVDVTWAELQVNCDYYSIANDSQSVAISSPLAQAKIAARPSGSQQVDHLAGLWGLSLSASTTSATATRTPQDHARLVDLALLDF